MSPLQIIAAAGLGVGAPALAVLAARRARRVDVDAAALAECIATYGPEAGVARYHAMCDARRAIHGVAAARGLALDWWETMRVENRVLPGLDLERRDADIAGALDLIEADRAACEAVLDAARTRGVTLDGTADAQHVLRLVKYGRPLGDVIDDVAAGRAA